MTNDTVSHFMNEAGRYPLLTPTEEIELSRRVARCQELMQLERELTKTEQRQLKSGLKARERLVKCNLRLLIHISKRFAPRIRSAGMDHIDLIQEGAIGLQRAAELFDGTKGYKFSTYAYWWIRQAMTRALEMQDRAVRVPTNALEKMNRALKMQHEFTQANGRKATIEELAALTETTPENLRLIIERSGYHTSLDSLAIEDGTALVDMLTDNEDLYDNLQLDWRSDDFERAFHQLDETDRVIIKKYYGLFGIEPITLGAIGKQLECSRERVRQRKDRALNKMFHYLKYSIPVQHTSQLTLIQ
jgi:RNA polymerase sigma factor (sigma-70 family)